jgi:hypothetical protein
LAVREDQRRGGRIAGGDERRHQARHRAIGADRGPALFHRGQRRKIESSFGPAIALALVESEQTVAHRRVGGLLQPRVDRGVGLVAVVQGIGANAFDDFEAHHFGQIGGVELDRRFVRERVVRLGLRGAHLFRRDHADVGHAQQHVVATFQRTIGIGQRVAAGREFGDRGQHRRFGEVEFRQLLSVVELRRRRNAVGAVPEEDLVEIKLQDLVLAQFPFETQRQEDLGDLAGHRIFVAEEEVACDLLGNGAAARDAAVVGGRQQPDRAQDAAPVDPRVFVEARVLDRQEGIAHHRRHFLDVDRRALGLAKQGDQLAVAGVHPERHLQADVADFGGLGQARFDHPVGHADRGNPENQAGQPQDQAPFQQPS